MSTMDIVSSYRCYASPRGPDGNGWLFQGGTAGCPGRIDPTETTFASVNDLASPSRAPEALRAARRELARLALRVHDSGL